MKEKEIINILLANQLKVTPQRIAILDVAYNLNNHPTTENIIENIKNKFPHIASGTIYKTLETFSDRGIIKKVTTTCDIMRYDTVQKKHHHLYCSDSDRIEDFFDETLDKIIEDHFRKKNIPDFKIKDIRVQIEGKFTDTEKAKKIK